MGTVSLQIRRSQLEPGAQLLHPYILEKGHLEQRKEEMIQENINHSITFSGFTLFLRYLSALYFFLSRVVYLSLRTQEDSYFVQFFYSSKL